MSKKTDKRSLPRGPHGLAREQVMHSQRERMLLAMTEATARKGYTATSVADVLAGAGVSRVTFYEQFRDKEDCFRAAFEHAADFISTRVMTESTTLAMGTSTPSPLEKLERVFSVYLDTLATQPAYARIFLVEVYAAGPDAVKQRLVSLQRFADIVCETFHGESGPLGTAPEQRFAAEVLVNAVSAMITNLIATGGHNKIHEIKAPMVKFVKDFTDATSGY